MKIIRRRTDVEHVGYSRSFEWRDMPGAGFGFPCDEKGNVNLDDLEPAARENYRKCVAGEIDVEDRGIERIVSRWVDPTVGLCDCGEEVELSRFTNTCECGADYNMSGQRLAPREFWGEETGESVADILMADTDPFGEP